MEELDACLVYNIIQIRGAGKRANTRSKFFSVKANEQFKHLPLRTAKAEVLH